MERYEIVYELHNILSCPGIWIEQEFDRVTCIWERNGTRYMVPFSKDRIVDINTGVTLNQSDIEEVDAFEIKKYRWMLVNKFNEKFF